MKALDTNVLARLLLQDDTAQFKRAKALLGSGEMFTAPVTVMLELVWVLESNDCSPAEIAHALAMLLDLPNFRLSQADALPAALGTYAQGMDFADALHLGLVSGADALLTFDKAFAKRARGAGSLVPVQVV
jgi:predicted nucleic-acid-binding protein